MDRRKATLPAALNATTVSGWETGPLLQVQMPPRAAFGPQPESGLGVAALGLQLVLGGRPCFSGEVWEGLRSFLVLFYTQVAVTWLWSRLVSLSTCSRVSVLRPAAVMV